MKKLALCIGNNLYGHIQELNYAVNDASSMSNKLCNLGFDTTFQKDQNLRDMAACIGDFINKLDSYDIAIFYYAGHGGELNKKNYLIPIDFEIPRNVVECEACSFSLDLLLERLCSYKNKQIIIILDACRSAIPFTRGGNIFSSFCSTNAPEGTLIAFSTSQGQTAAENNYVKHGIYTYCLLEHIATPRVPIEFIFKKVRESLALKSNYKQISWEHTSLIGDCYLNPGIMCEGIFYSEKALADEQYVFNEGSKIGKIVQALKSINWYEQNPAIEKIKEVDLNQIAPDELFVLGRNIYQAACGDAYLAKSFIHDFDNIMREVEVAKVHLLNGMAYEIYFDKENKLRNSFKDQFSAPILSLLEETKNYSSAAFIANVLKTIPERIIYIPSYSGLLSFSVEISEDDSFYDIESITLQGTPLSIKPVEGYHGSGLHSLASVQEKIRHIIAKSIVAPIENIDIRLTGVDVSSNSKRLRADSHIILKR